VLCVTDQASSQEFKSILKTFSSFVAARFRFADALPSAVLGPGRAPLSARPYSWRSKAALSTMHLATFSNMLATTSALSNAPAVMPGGSAFALGGETGLARKPVNARACK
jgi:hypothetical protein|tara:strand:+ start:225 stop:554 length:330 start_codon:yes stop_codon:yes gene_type:complete